MENLELLKKRLVSDGELSNADIAELRKALLDDKMTIEKAEFLFTLKDSVNKKKVASDFKALFVDAITSLLIEDEDSPGEIDDSEAKWLRAKIQSNGGLDEIDRALLNNLKEKSINFPSILNYKSSLTRNFERCLYFSRYLTLLAVFGSLLSAIALFI